MIEPIVSEWRRIGREIRPALPGLYLVIAVAVVARYLHSLIPYPGMARAVSEALIAVFLGLHIRNALHFSPRFDAGVKFALQRILRLGIILLGLRLSLQDVVNTGLSALVLIVACIAFVFGLAHVLGRLLKIPPRLALLIGVGTAVCGNTAIVATAPVIEAEDQEVSFAVAMITFFGTLAVILYPILAYFVGLNDRTFGLWAGTAVNDTSQVVAAGAAFSEAARDIATVVKLTRNTLMAPLIVLIGVAYGRAQRRSRAGSTPRLDAGKAMPWFVLSFLAMTLVRTAGVGLGLLPGDVGHPAALTAAASVLKFVDEVARFAVLMALAAVGLGTDTAAVRQTGIKPLALALILASVLALFSLGLITLTGLGR